MAVEYCHLLVGSYRVDNDEKRKRGWRHNGLVIVASQETESESVTHEVIASDNSSFSIRPFTAEDRRAFVALLNRLAFEGWRVANHSFVQDSGSTLLPGPTVTGP